MKNIEVAVEAVSKAEAKLRELIGGAASNGNYSAVRRLSTAAERLAIVKGELGGTTTNKGVNAIRPLREQRPGRAKSARSRSRPSGYPRFELRGDVLCRIGWSRKSKREYEHKVPKAVFEQAVEMLATISERSGGTFAAQEVWELGREKGRDLPSYQVYATLAMLCEAGVMERHGRDGYTVTASNLPGAAELAWAQVPTA